ncbi:hypothetical protein BDZ97DRAFT_1846335, partial [Flammula alnicola]
MSRYLMSFISIAPPCLAKMILNEIAVRELTSSGLKSYHQISSSPDLNFPALKELPGSTLFPYVSSNLNQTMADSESTLTEK